MFGLFRKKPIDLIIENVTKTLGMPKPASEYIVTLVVSILDHDAVQALGGEALIAKKGTLYEYWSKMKEFYAPPPVTLAVTTWHVSFEQVALALDLVLKMLPTLTATTDQKIAEYEQRVANKLLAPSNNA